MTAAQNTMDQSVVEDIAKARCDRERRCGNVGAGKGYVSRDVCMDQMRGSIASDLNASNCPGGINRQGVERCEAAIQSEDCGHPLDTITRMDHCKASALCLK